MKAVKEIWVRSAQAMGADDRRLFRHVILPGALPYILTGLRLGLAQAWRILVGVEMLAAVPWGLGWLIFGAREFLNTDVMLAGVAVIGIIGLALEKLVFQQLEQLHGRPLGHDGVMTRTTATRSLRRAAITLHASRRRSTKRSRAAAISRPRCCRPCPPSRSTLVDDCSLDGTMLGHAFHTLYRVLFGFALAVVVALPLGILMARFRRGRELLPAAGQRADADPVARLGAGLHPLVRPRQHRVDPHRVLCGDVPDAAQHLVGRARGQPAVAARGRRHGRRRDARCSGR